MDRRTWLEAWLAGPLPGRWSLLRAVYRGVATLLAWQDRVSQRRVLATLDDRMLKDLGLSRSDVASEVAKPFWRA